MITTTLAAATPAAFARGRPASSLAAEQPLSAPTFPRWKGTADHLSSATLAALVALLAVLAALVAPGIASGLDGSPGGHASVVGAASAEAHPALRSPDLETRVRASDDADGTHVGVNSADLGILHPGSDVFYDQLASGWLVAPRGAEDALAACRTNSFVPGTLVLRADGTTKPIEDIEIGDWVWATDPQTGEAGPRRVTDTIVGDGAKELVDIEIDGTTITATDGHPFWVDDQGAWVDAEDLEAGDLFVLADGTTVDVDAVAERSDVLTVHNLTVDGIHTYHVMAGHDPVLVHNCTPLTRGEQRLLGGLVDEADSGAFDVLRSRGGGALNVRGAGLQDDMGQWTLRELAHEARQGNRQAERWIKMIKQAGTQGKGGQ